MSIKVRRVFYRGSKWDDAEATVQGTAASARRTIARIPGGTAGRMPVAFLPGAG